MLFDDDDDDDGKHIMKNICAQYQYWHPIHNILLLSLSLLSFVQTPAGCFF